MNKQDLVNELRKQGFGRLADLLDAEVVPEPEAIPQELLDWATPKKTKGK